MCLGISFKNLFCVHLYGQCQCDIITSPTSPITIPKGEFVDINLGNTNCESYIKVVGNLPPGLIDVRSSKISGWPTVAGTYSFLLQANGCDSCEVYCLIDCLHDYYPECFSNCMKNCGCSPCTTSLPITIYVIDKDAVDESTPYPPEITRSYQRVSPNAAAVDSLGINARAKCSESLSHVNIVKWKSPKRGPTPVAYAVYQDKALKKYITTITNEGQFRFKFKQLNRSLKRINHFYIISIAESGSISRPVVARIKNRDR